MMTLYLNQKLNSLENSNVKVFVLHPGVVKTDLYVNEKWLTVSLFLFLSALFTNVASSRAYRFFFSSTLKNLLLNCYKCRRVLSYMLVKIFKSLQMQLLVECTDFYFFFFIINFKKFATLLE